MGSYKLCWGFLTAIIMYLLMAHQANAAPGIPSNIENVHRARNRPFLHVPVRPINQYARIKPDLGDFIVDDDDFYEINKRQTSDDYGHLRFGKRDEFDDYGHMRFGRSSGSATNNDNINNNNARE